MNAKTPNHQGDGSSAHNRATEGFFALFDVLGYRQLNRESELEKLISLYHNVVDKLEERVLTVNGLDKSQMLLHLEQPRVGTLVFSDTIALYQPEGSHRWFSEPLLLVLSCVLLRLAFEAGIPVRGAISYGEYYVHERCFLGHPIVEAYDAEREQDWCGAILCKSATRRMREISKEIEERKPVEWRGLRINWHSWFRTSRHVFLFRYPVPFKSGKSKESALCWGDAMAKYMGLQVPTLNIGVDPSSIEQRVLAKFGEHGKTASEPVQSKIRNTIQFLQDIRRRPIPYSSIQYVP